MNNFTRKFGIELEISGISRAKSLQAIQALGIRCFDEDYNHIDSQDHWKIVRDSSVRDGHEVVSPILIGQQGLDEAIRVADALNAAGASANRTCGLHVHFDATSMNTSGIKMICKRYAKFESQIDGFMPKSRRANENRFCRSVIDIFKTSQFDNAGCVDELVDSQPDRYFKINLRSYFRHHTIEFRQHSGTVDSEKIKNWILFLNDFVTESCRMADEECRIGLETAGTSKIQKSWQNLINLISESENGMLASDIIERLGIQPHSLRGQISHMRAAGIGIQTTRTPQGSIYRFNGQVNTARRSEDDLYNGVNAETREFLTNRARYFLERAA